MSERPDITERLRNPGWNGYVYDSDREDGAAEIERLREELDFIMNEGGAAEGEVITAELSRLRARCAQLEKALDKLNTQSAHVCIGFGIGKYDMSDAVKYLGKCVAETDKVLDRATLNQGQDNDD